jgi:plasmid replication initiation protein
LDNGAQELRLFEHEGGPLIQVEINLEEAPLFMLQKNEQDGEDVIESRSVVMTREGHRMEQYWRVTAHRDFGLPGAVDEHVFIAVMQLIQRRGGMPPDGHLTFTLYELLEILGKTHGGKNYEELRDSLDRIASTNVYAENAFYSLADEDFKSHRFHLWDVTFRKKKRRGRASEHHTLKFSDVLASSFAAGYLKSLDADFYNSLKRDLARSLYRLVDAKRKKRLSWSVELQQLRQMVSMPPSYRYASKIKEKLLPAHEELQRRGYLDRAEIEEIGRGREKRHVVHYRVSPRFVRERTDPTSGLSEPQRYAVGALAAHGVWAETARELVLEHGPDHCLYYVELLPYQKGVRDRGAWLRKYVENGWPLKAPDEADAPSREASAPPLPIAPADPDTDRPPVPKRGEPDADELFAALFSDLGDASPDVATRSWFGAYPVASLEGHTLTLTLPTTAARDYVDGELRPGLEKALRDRLSPDARLHVACPAASPADRSAREAEFRGRLAAGEFDRAISTFESLPYEEYRKWVGQSPTHPDGNRYHLGLDGDLFVYVGGKDPDHRHFLRRLERQDR